MKQEQRKQNTTLHKKEKKKHNQNDEYKQKEEEEEEEEPFIHQIDHDGHIEIDRNGSRIKNQFNSIVSERYSMDFTRSNR